MRVIMAVKRQGRAAYARRDRALKGKGIGTANLELYNALKVLATMGECQPPEVDHNGLVILHPEQRAALGIDE